MLRYLNLLVVAVVAGAGLGYLAFCREPAVYESAARLVIPAQAASPMGSIGPRPVRHAMRDLLSAGTIDRALQNSELLAIRSRSGGPLTADDLRQSVAIDNGDEPPGVILLHCRASSAKAAQSILASVIDAYLVEDASRRDVQAGDIQRLLQQAQDEIRLAKSDTPAMVRLQKLLDSFAQSPVDPTLIDRLSRQRAALLLRRNALQRQFAQLESGKPAAPEDSPPESPSAASAQTPRVSAPAMTPVATVGNREREAELRAADDKLAERYGPQHPQRRAIALEIELLGKYPPEQAQLLAERWQLLQQFGPGHPRLQAINQRLEELGISPDAAAPELTAPVVTSAPAGDATLERLKTLRAALAELDAEDHLITGQVEVVNRLRDLSDELRQTLATLPAGSGRSETGQALEHLQHLAALATAVRPYVAMRPTAGVRDYAGLVAQLTRGAGIGFAAGAVLSLLVLWASRKK